MVTATRTAQITPPRLLVHANPEKKAWWKATPEASRITIKDIEKLLGIPVYRLGRLLGLQSPLHVYTWTSQGGRVRRPSQLMMLRLFCIVKLKYVEGIEIWRIKSIDWEKGTAEFNDEGTDFNLASKQDVPDAKWRFTG